MKFLHHFCSWNLSQPHLSLERQSAGYTLSSQEWQLWTKQWYSKWALERGHDIIDFLFSCWHCHEHISRWPTQNYCDLGWCCANVLNYASLRISIDISKQYICQSFSDFRNLDGRIHGWSMLLQCIKRDSSSPTTLEDQNQEAHQQYTNKHCVTSKTTTSIQTQEKCSQ